MSARVWLVTFRVKANAALEGRDVQHFANEQARFLSSQSTGLDATEVRFEVAAIEAADFGPGVDDVEATGEWPEAGGA